MVAASGAGTEAMVVSEADVVEVSEVTAEATEVDAAGSAILMECLLTAHRWVHAAATAIGEAMVVDEAVVTVAVDASTTVGLVMPITNLSLHVGLEVTAIVTGVVEAATTTTAAITATETTAKNVDESDLMMGAVGMVGMKNRQEVGRGTEEVWRRLAGNLLRIIW